MRKVAIVGAGYIGPWHIEAIKRCSAATLVGVCDQSLVRAEALANANAVPAFGTLQAMVTETGCDAVHVLVPPPAHAAIATEAMQLGVDCFIEKPLAPTKSECDSLTAVAEETDKRVGVNHNFLLLPSSQQLVNVCENMSLGKLRRVDVQWSLPLPQILFGPHGQWPFSCAAGPLLEVGAHAVAFARRLVPRFRITHAQASDRRDLSLKRWCYQRWQLFGTDGNTDVSISVDMGATTPSMKVRAIGGAAEAELDYERDLFQITQPATSGVVLGPYFVGRNQIRQLSRGVNRNAIRQAVSFDKLSPFGLSLACSVERFHSPENELDIGQSLSFANSIVDDLQIAASMAKADDVFTPQANFYQRRKCDDPRILVTGGTGYIGSRLVESLIADGHKVRALTRGYGDELQAKFAGKIDVCRGDGNNASDLQAALVGIERVVHLARGDGKTWADYVRTDVQPTELLGKLALAAGVKSFVYTGTIDSYNSANASTVIDDTTPIDSRIDRRNLYARSKACGETELRRLEENGLPLIIARPGIVIGGAGSPNHWGVGMWFGRSTCRYWGRGDHPLPFVLVQDVVAALHEIALANTLAGKTYLLTGPPLLTARQYISEFERTAQTKLDVAPKSIFSYYSEDLLKYTLKSIARKPAVAPSLHDWSCRAHRSRYAAEAAEKDFGWRPVSDRDKLVSLGIHDPVKRLY